MLRTFSTFAVDTAMLSQRASFTAAAMNLLVNNVLSIAAVTVGLALSALMSR